MLRRPFRHQGREFVHLENGWCARFVTSYRRTPCWRIYWGAIQPGAERPGLPKVYRENDEPVEFEELEGAVEWVKNRRLL